MKITAPFQTLFAKKSSNNLTELNSLIDGTLEVFNEYSKETEIYDVQLKMRGNMTLSYCDFPKLKIKFKKEQTSKKRLFNRKSYDLATHCINQVTEYSSYFTSKILAASPHRESCIFELQHDLGLVSPLTRNAVIDYIDNSLPEQIITYKNKNAFFSESTGSLTKRLNALYPVIGIKDFSKKLLPGAEDDADDLPQRLFVNVKENPQVSLDEVLKLTLFQILVSNRDFFIKTDSTISPYGDIQLWNVKLIAQDEKKWMIYGNDFNLASIIQNGEQTESQFAAPMKDIDKFKIIGSGQDRRKALEFYQSNKDFLYSKVETLAHDQDFQKNYKFYLDEFYKFIDTLVVD